MGVQSARSLTPHRRRRAVALAGGHYELLMMTAGISREISEPPHKNPCAESILVMAGFG